MLSRNSAFMCGDTSIHRQCWGVVNYYICAAVHWYFSYIHIYMVIQVVKMTLTFLCS